MNTKEVKVETATISLSRLIAIGDTIRKMECCKDSLLGLIECIKIQYQAIKAEAEIKLPHKEGVK